MGAIRGLRPLPAAGLAATAAVVNLCLYTDVVDALLVTPWRHRLRSLLPPWAWQWLPRSFSVRWTSNIPGNPYGCDALSTQIAGPFPMSVDQSACLGAVPTPFALEGLAPRGARYWSIQVFCKKAANPLNERRGGAADDDGARRTHTLFDGDLSLDGDGRYAVAVGAAAVAGFKDFANYIDVGDAKKCLVVIRCLKLPEGRRWRAPAVRALPGGAPWPARDVERRCGQLATAEAPRGPAARLRGCVWINAAAVALRPELARALVAGAALAVSLRSALSRALATKYRRDRGRGVPNRDVRAIAGLGGCAGHLYWSGPYDAREGDVAVTFVVDVWVPGSPPGQEKRAKLPTSKAPLSAVFHSFRLIFGRAIISRNGLEAWMLFPERSRAEHSC